MKPEDRRQKLGALGEQIAQTFGSTNPPLMGVGFIAPTILIVADRNEHPDYVIAPKVETVLDDLLSTAGIPYERLFITAFMKHSDCTPKQAANFLKQQIAIQTPYLIALIGKQVVGHYFGDKPTYQIHGIAYEQEGHLWYPLMRPEIVYHNPAMRFVMEEDFKNMHRLTYPHFPYNKLPEQLDLF